MRKTRIYTITLMKGSCTENNEKVYADDISEALKKALIILQENKSSARISSIYEYGTIMVNDNE